MASSANPFNRMPRLLEAARVATTDHQIGTSSSQNHRYFRAQTSRCTCNEGALMIKTETTIHIEHGTNAIKDW